MANENVGAFLLHEARHQLLQLQLTYAAYRPERQRCHRVSGSYTREFALGILQGIDPGLHSF